VDGSAHAAACGAPALRTRETTRWPAAAGCRKIKQPRTWRVAGGEVLARSPVSAPLSPSVADPSGSSGSPNDTTEAKRSRITPAGIRSGPSSSVPDFGTGMLASQISLPLPSADSPTKRGLPDGVRGRVSRARWHRRWPLQREVFTRANHAPTPQWLVERVAPRETPPTGRGGALGSLPPYRMGELFDAVFCQNQSHSFQLSKSFFRFSTPKLPDGVSYTHIFDEMPFSLHICQPVKYLIRISY
jgi:hypothetical protein